MLLSESCVGDSSCKSGVRLHMQGASKNTTDTMGVRAGCFNLKSNTKKEGPLKEDSAEPRPAFHLSPQRPRLCRSIMVNLALFADLAASTSQGANEDPSGS